MELALKAVVHLRGKNLRVRIPIRSGEHRAFPGKRLMGMTRRLQRWQEHHIALFSQSECRRSHSARPKWQLVFTDAVLRIRKFAVLVRFAIEIAVRLGAHPG